VGHEELVREGRESRIEELLGGGKVNLGVFNA
jgi:hypothetical protein